MSAPAGKPVVCFGELMLRLSPPGRELLLQSPHFRTWFGGSELNVAIGLAHLGMPSAYVTRLPENAIGDAALSFVRGEGVDVRHVARGGARVGIYYVESGADLRPMRVVYDRAGSALAEMSAGDVDWSAALAGAGGLHLSGITSALGAGPAAAAIEAASEARRLGVPVSVDLNFRPALWAGRDPRPHVEPLARAADLLIGNPGAFDAMLGVPTPSGAGDAMVREASRRVHETLGCARVSVTRREVRSATDHGWSTCLYDAATDGFHTSRRFDVRVEDRVGGGDSFVAGLLYAFRAGRALQEALEFATAASALKLTIPGDANRVSAAQVDTLLVTLR